MSNDPFYTIVETIPYQYRHPRFLHAMMRWLKVKTAIEIGCHIGYSSCWMAQALKEEGGGMLFCIDPFCWVNEEQEKQWHENIDRCGVREFVTLIKGRSQEVEWPKAEFVFIDGNHTYPVAKHDAEKSRDNGAICIVLHDTVAWDGSRKHADEIRTDPAWSEWDKLETNFDCGMMMLVRRSEKPPSWGEDSGEMWDKPTQKEGSP